MLKINPIPSIRMVGVRVTVGELTLRIPPLPASAWLEKLYVGGVGDILELCQDSEALEDAIAEGRMGDLDLDRTLEQMLAAASGREFRVAVELIGFARAAWARIGGELARAGLRLDAVPLGMFLDAVYGIATRNMNPEELDKFDATLLGPGAQTSRGVGRPKPSPVPANAEQYVMTRTKTRIQQTPPRPGDPTPRPIRLPASLARSGPRATSERPAVAAWPASERVSRRRPTPPTPRVR